MRLISIFLSSPHPILGFPFSLSFSSFFCLFVLTKKVKWRVFFHLSYNTFFSSFTLCVFYLSVGFFFFFSFFGWDRNNSAQGVQKFPGQELNLHHSSDPSCCSDNAGSLTHSTTRELPVSFYILILCLFRAASMAHGYSQVRGRVGAVAAGLRHSRGNTRSQPHL